MHLDEPELRALFQRGLSGNQKAYREFLTHMSTLLRAYVRRQLRRVGRVEHDAEDIVQEALLAIHSKRHSYDSEIPVTAWAYALTRYKLIDFLRSTNKTVGVLALDDIEDVVSKAGPTFDVVLAVRAAVDGLPEKMRRQVELMKFQGFSASEVAASEGTSKAAVRVNVHRGLKAIARALGGEAS